MLEVRSFTKTYSTIPALESVSFTIKPGQVLGYLGPNGSGKSTTAKIITGLLEPNAGSVFFKGESIKAMGEWWRYPLVAALSAVAWLELRRRRKANERDEEGLSFEERAPSEFELLKLA